jgi:hypothetical protein
MADPSHQIETTMSKLNEYRQKLRELKDWTPFLQKNSGLPGPRGNLELAQAVVEEASEKQVEEFLSIPIDQAKENTPKVFLVFCGVTALGKRISRGNQKEFARLRQYASDPRWRIREATAIALQYVGDENMEVLLKEAKVWSKGNWFEKRAAAAGLAEPRLLKVLNNAKRVLQILDEVTATMETAGDSTDEAFKVLRQGMGYCWSVAVSALPEEGKPLMEKWLTSRSGNVRWIMKENLKKNRLVKMDAMWVKACNVKLSASR